MDESAISKFDSGKAYRPLRLSTLVRIRWLALTGQAASVLFTEFGLGFSLPLVPCLTLIGLSALFNVGLVIRFGAGYRPTNTLAAAQLAFDSLQLAGLLWLTGGLTNPFAILLLAPVSVSASILPQRETIWVSALAVALTTVLLRSHLPLPWIYASPLEFDPLYVGGIWIALLCGFVFVAVYAGRVAHEARQLSDALAATELALSHQQKLSALDGLAAAAAHELGTPLSAIALAAREMVAEFEEGPHGKSLLRTDAELIIEQSNRCRKILAKLRGIDEGGKPLFASLPVTELLAELSQSFSHYKKHIEIRNCGPAADEPQVARNVGLLYGLVNLIENAVQFAHDEVIISADWRYGMVKITIQDDGPGFAPDMLGRLGDPYITSKNRGRKRGGGLGLGVFIAKTLLERTGATLAFANSKKDAHARIVLSWSRVTLDAQR